MPEVDVNAWAVIVSAIVSMVLGMVWYSPRVFGNAWMKELGATPSQIEEAKKKGMGKTYALAFVGSLLMSYILFHIADYAGANTAGEGIQTGFWTWLGFVAPVTLGSVLWDGKSWKYWSITSGYYLVFLLVAGTIVAIWA